MLADLEYRWLKKIYPLSPDLLTEDSYRDKSKLSLLGDDLTAKLRGKVVLDFGCGSGNQVIDMIQLGARRVIGLDVQEPRLEEGRRKAAALGLADKCSFAVRTTERVDVITSIDAFEHFADPAEILQLMASLLQPGGEVIFSFGPTWYHPLGGHVFSVFPWAHILFTEKAFLRWRGDFKNDGATRFSEVAGGLNQMTIRRFESLVQQSPFDLAELECVPIRRLKPLHNRLTREATTALCRGRLILR